MCRFCLKSKDWTICKEKMGKGGECLNTIPNVSPTRTLQWLWFLWPKFYLWNAKQDWSPWLMWDTGTDDGQGYFLQEKPLPVFPWLFLLILGSLGGKKLGKDFGMSCSFWSTRVCSLQGLEKTFWGSFPAHLKVLETKFQGPECPFPIPATSGVWIRYGATHGKEPGKNIPWIQLRMRT